MKRCTKGYVYENRLMIALKGCVLVLLSSFFGAALLAAEPGQERPTVVIVVGAAGEEEFGAAFSKWAGLWEKAGAQGGAKIIRVGPSNSQTNSAQQPDATPSDRERLQEALANEPKEGAELWLVLLGHGTFDGKEAKFNLRGPDFTGTELAAWLKPFHRPLAVIDTSSSSGPFINKLSAPGRVVVTATRSGYEQNYARFGQYLAEGITDAEADLDKDGQTSLLEAFLIASRRMAQFYQVEGRLATEHPLIDDNGDGLGTPADWFRGIRAFKKAKDGAALDGPRAHQFHLLRNDAERNLPAPVRLKRDEMEMAILKLRDSKSQLGEEDYYQQLEPLLLELAHLYQSIDASGEKTDGPPPKPKSTEPPSK